MLDPTPLREPRRLIEADIGWMETLAKRRYGDFDVKTATRWLVEQVLPDPYQLYLPIRTADAFLISGLSAMPWNLNQSISVVLTMVTEPHATWQGVRLLRASVNWARARKAVRWQFHFDNRDAGPMLRRVGARPLKGFYEVPICPSQGFSDQH